MTAAPLRDFALVAIAQHAPKSLSRMRGTDFRLPTDEELDALVAYQLALGRQEDFDLPSLEAGSPFTPALAKSSISTVATSSNPATRTATGVTSTAVGRPGCRSTIRFRDSRDIDGSQRGFNIGALTNLNETPLALALGLPRDGGFGQLS